MKSILFKLAFILNLAISLSSEAAATKICSQNQHHHLTQSIKRTRPTKYDLLISIEPKAAPFFEGNVKIDLEIEKLNNEVDFKDNQIVLKADKSLKIYWLRYIDYGNKNLTSPKPKGIEVVDFCRQNDTNSFLIINLAEELKFGSLGRLQISFTGKMDGDNLMEEEENSDVNMSMFGAKLEFPSFDDWQLKTVIDLSLICPADWRAESNSKPTVEKMLIPNEPSGRKLIKFGSTKAIPTNELVLLVKESDFSSLPSVG